MEYLWGAVWCFYPEGDTTAETWVRAKALAILEGRARQVAAGIRRRASTMRLPCPNARRPTRGHLPDQQGRLPRLPDRAGGGVAHRHRVIEGTCRYLVADRMDITGARWSVEGAEAVLELRAVRTNDDFDQYWKFHLDKERHRIHETRYTHQTIPTAA